MEIPHFSINGLDFKTLQTPEGLSSLDDAFLAYLKDQDTDCYQTLLEHRRLKGLNGKALSQFLIQGSQHLETYLAKTLGITEAVAARRLVVVEQNPIFVFKAWYVQRKAKRLIKQGSVLPDFDELDAWLIQQVKSHVAYPKDPELAVAQWTTHCLKQPVESQDSIDKVSAWCAHKLKDKPRGIHDVSSWVSFKIPYRIDPEHLVPVEPVPDDVSSRLQGVSSKLRQRRGFKLTDPRMSQRDVLDEVNYCVYCHEQEGDFCSKGFPVKKTEPEQGLKKDAFDQFMTGCPLEEKISEMNVLKQAGHVLAPLAVVMVDNPMCPVTGHRICNDCMKACIYQKQKPVDIPQIETRVLTDVLDLPWGVEIYHLLTVWNPLRAQQWVARPYNGKKVLVMGMGPAGFTLAHHLLMEGMAVVGVDGLKIEPLDESLIHAPVYHYQSWVESLDERILAGFGGVAEYGITVRWDKNFLKLIYITLMRRPYFQVFGSVRFGGTLTVEDAWRLGFDHLAVAVGAGLPKALPVPGSMAPGMRQANDFLMALQLTGAAKKSSLANLQIRLPAVVIGGGLTGIDTATEVQAYYLAQIEKVSERYHRLTKHYGEAAVRARFDDVSLAILDQWLEHAEQARRTPLVGTVELLRRWGGVTVVYRRQLRESPAYQRNHEEVVKALEEGIYYAEDLEPVSIERDSNGHVVGLVCRRRILDEQGLGQVSDEEHVIPCGSVLVATGASLNVAYEFEHRGTFNRQGLQYEPFESDKHGRLSAVATVDHCKQAGFGPFTSYAHHDYRVTFLGDTHPVFHGSVVKAIASAQRTYPYIVQLMKQTSRDDSHVHGDYEAFAASMQSHFQAELVALKRHTPCVVEITVKALQAAQNFKPGQFYRFQNYETLAPVVEGTRLQTEALALDVVEVDKKTGLIRLIVVEKSASSRLVGRLKPGQPVSLMGPTGVRMRVDRGAHRVLILGGQLSIAQTLAIATQMSAAGNHVTYVVWLEKPEDMYCKAQLKEATDAMYSVVGNCVENVTAFLTRPQGLVDVQNIDRILLLGEAKVVKPLYQALQGTLKPYFKKHPEISSSVYGPMQCMLKGVCAQCLQWQVDPETGQRTKAVFACSWQNQPADKVDYRHLEARGVQNRVQEILSTIWLDYVFAKSNKV